MRVLFIGGTGLISSACSPLAVERGMDLTLLNRGTSHKASAPEGARVITGDITDVEALRTTLAEDVAKHGKFDAVVQWICFSPEHMATDIDTFADLTDQYVFISSASAYETPPRHWLTTEETPLDNPYWQYSRDKAECERLLQVAAEERGFRYTIVRPSHTYGYPDIPMAITSWGKPWTIVDRIQRGEKFIVHGDGTSLWTLTDHRDFAVGLVGLLGNPAAINEDFTIVSDDVLSWNEIHAAVADAVGVSREQLASQQVFIPTDLLVKFDPEAFEGPIMGDKANSAVFDTSKLRAAVPDFAPVHRFRDSVKESVAWFMADDSRRGIDDDANAAWDDVIARYERGVDAMLDGV